MAFAGLPYSVRGHLAEFALRRAGRNLYEAKKQHKKLFSWEKLRGQPLLPRKKIRFHGFCGTPGTTEGYALLNQASNVFFAPFPHFDF
jgi:hypothetical protein